MYYTRVCLFAPILATASVASAADLDGDGCEDAQLANNGACIHDTASLDATVTTSGGTVVAEGSSVGPFVSLGDVFIARNATIDGWVAHSTRPLTIADGTVIGRRADIGADSILGEDTSISRAATLGARVTTGVGVSVGYAAVLGSDVVLEDGAVTGNLVGLGDFTHLGPLSVIGRRTTVTGGASILERTSVLGTVGPGVDIGAGVLIDSTARVRNNATIESGARVMAGATIGRDGFVEEGAIVHGSVRPRGRVCADSTVVVDEVVPRNMTNEGSTCGVAGGLGYYPTAGDAVAAGLTDHWLFDSVWSETEGVGTKVWTPYGATFADDTSPFTALPSVDRPEVADFDGFNDYARQPLATISGAVFTQIFWVYMDAANPVDRSYIYDAQQSGRWYLIYDQSDRPSTNACSGQWYMPLSNTTGSWTMHVSRQDGTRVYYDRFGIGDQYSQINSSGSCDQSDANAFLGTFYGVAGGSGRYFFNGKVAELSVYNGTSLSDGEIQAIYDSRKPLLYAQ
ncbi:MAG: UDP-3-O-[3-hydroxymyristoyl] glucosamine N-acyltransferase [Myxococcota bacterium]|jgi:UDP-3-O-[3-hydroxymyristoyl] glucosamine N-acyltransferase